MKIIVIVLVIVAFFVAYEVYRLDRRMKSLQQTVDELQIKIETHSSIKPVSHAAVSPSESRTASTNSVKKEIVPMLSQRVVDLEDNEDDVHEDGGEGDVDKEEKEEADSARYTMLSVKDGKLVPIPESAEDSYFKCWREDNKLMFDFCVRKGRLKRVLNNQDYFLTPFCEVERLNQAYVETSIENVEPGQLGEDYSVAKKAKVKLK